MPQGCIQMFSYDFFSIFSQVRGSFCVTKVRGLGPWPPWPPLEPPLHGKHTRNANNSLELPKIRTVYARKSFYYTGEKIYNEVPLKIRTITNAIEYEKSLEIYFS